MNTGKKKIDPKVNRARVKKCMENRDRINVTLPKGTVDKIHSYGFAANLFARELIIAELEKLDKARSEKSDKTRHWRVLLDTS